MVDNIIETLKMWMPQATEAELNGYAQEIYDNIQRWLIGIDKKLNE